MRRTRGRTRKAGEIYNFATIMAENDIVLACDGQTVRGVGRVKGPYEFDGKLKFAHKRPVQWTLVEPWTMPEKEGLQTTVFELGRKAKNLLELEQRLFEKGSSSGTQVPTESQARRE
jgi:5-methylcytosine-specific restriction protein B